MKLKGSCSCGAVRFSVQCKHPVPYQRCYCSICRKTSGGGGYAINLGGDHRTLQVQGSEHVRIYRAQVQRGGKLEQSDHERHFCGQCGSHLWAYCGRWPDLVHPVAGAIDTDIPLPAENVHVMTASRAGWVKCEGNPQDAHFPDYPEASLAHFHEARGWVAD